MSSFLSKADALRTHLLTLPEVGDDDVIVDRQKNLVVEVAKRVGQAKGGVITILWGGGKNRNPNSKARLQLDNRYFVRVWANPILRDENDAAVDDLVEAVAAEMHGWIVNPESPLSNQRRMKVQDVDLVPHNKYLIYEIFATSEFITNP